METAASITTTPPVAITPSSPAASLITGLPPVDRTSITDPPAPASEIAIPPVADKPPSFKPPVATLPPSRCPPVARTPPPEPNPPPAAGTPPDRIFPPNAVAASPGTIPLSRRIAPVETIPPLATTPPPPTTLPPVVPCPPLVLGYPPVFASGRAIPLELTVQATSATDKRNPHTGVVPICREQQPVFTLRIEQCTPEKGKPFIVPDGTQEDPPQYRRGDANP